MRFYYNKHFLRFLLNILIFQLCPIQILLNWIPPYNASFICFANSLVFLSLPTIIYLIILVNSHSKCKCSSVFATEKTKRMNNRSRRAFGYSTNKCNIESRIYLCGSFFLNFMKWLTFESVAIDSILCLTFFSYSVPFSCCFFPQIVGD